MKKLLQSIRERLRRRERVTLKTPRPKIRLSRLRDIGWELWDPIGLMPAGCRWDDEGSKYFANEYDRYLIYAAGQLRRGVSDKEVTRYLVEIESQYMGLGRRHDTEKRAAAVVAAIRADDALWTDTKMDLNSLRSRWTADDIATTGREIYQAVPEAQRPDWAGAILLYVAGEEFLCRELANLVDIAIDDKRWIEAKDAFSAVRELTLQNERRGGSGTKQQMVLDIGETAAKVIYNATKPLAPFDYHAGWSMAPRVRLLTDFVGQQEFEDSCWNLLIRRRPEA